MKTLIIFYSAHHGNTEKVAMHLCRELDFECVSIDEAGNKDLSEYTGIIFGSGIYAYSISKLLIKFIESRADELRDKKLGLILTSGILNKKFAAKTEKLFTDLGLSIDRTFQCLGYDTFGPLRFIGGINKKRPNEEDLRGAVEAFKSF